MQGRREWGVLASWASTAVYADLIGPPQASKRAAIVHAAELRRHGADTAIVSRVGDNDAWRTTDGRTAVQALRDYIETGYFRKARP